MSVDCVSVLRDELVGGKSGDSGGSGSGENKSCRKICREQFSQEFTIYHWSQFLGQESVTPPPTTTFTPLSQRLTGVCRQVDDCVVRLQVYLLQERVGIDSRFGIQRDRNGFDRWYAQLLKGEREKLMYVCIGAHVLSWCECGDNLL